MEYYVDYDVDDGHHTNFESLLLDEVVPILTQWANEVKEITDAPDLGQRCNEAESLPLRYSRPTLAIHHLPKMSSAEAVERTAP